MFKKMDTYSRKYWCVVYEIIRVFFFFSTSLIIFRTEMTGRFSIAKKCMT